MCLLGTLMIACHFDGWETNVPLIHYQVVNTLPHDTKAFTQGLVMHEGKLYEGTGSNDSWIAELDPNTGVQHKKVQLDSKYFGEGITVLNNKLYQLTWTDNLGFIYELPTFKKIGEFAYATEGWGLTTDGEYLIMSDGSDKIYFLDSLSLDPVRTLTIREKNSKVRRINELEWADGYIYANQWRSNYILKIDPATERVVAKIDLSALADEVKNSHPGADVLNGIAYNRSTGEFLITGKYWPQAYWIRLEQ